MCRWSIIAAIFLLLTVVSTSVVASEPETDDATSVCDVEMILGGVACVTDEGEEVWRNEHPSLWPDSETYPEPDEDVVVAARLATIDGRPVYTVNADLLEVDPATGSVVRRVRFPGIITDFATVDGRLELTVRYNTWWAGDEDEEVALRFGLDDPDPAQASWSLEGFYWSYRDATWLVEEMDGEDDLVVAEELERRYERDPTNPFFALRAGVAYRDAGDEESAQVNFERAADSTEAPWIDLLLLSTKLEEIDVPEAAQRAFERGVDRMDEVGIEPERMGVSAEMTMVFSHYHEWDGDGPGVLPQAVEAEDVETVHRLSRRLAEVFPNVEEGHVAWRALADWLEVRDRPELADEWRERAETNLETRTGHIVPVDQLNRGFLAMWASLLALVIVLFGLGARIGVAHYRRSEAMETPDDAPRFPGLRWRDLVVPLLLVLTFGATAVMTVDNLTESLERSTVPLELQNDALASPTVEHWLTEILAESPEQRQLLAIARAEQKALKAGEPLPEKEPIFELLDDAIAHHVAEGKLTGMQYGGDSIYREFIWVWLFGPFVFLVMCAVVVSMVAGRMFPRVGTWISRVVPGGSPRFGPVGGLLAAAGIAALFVVVGLDSMMRSLLVSDLNYYIDYFGLADMPPSDHYDLSREFAWLTLAVATVSYVVLVVFDSDQFLEFDSRDS